MRLAGKVAVITGGARGIGGATAQLYAQEGAKVVIGDLLAQEAEETLSAIRAANGEATFVRTDVTKEEECAALIEAAVNRYGQLDILVTAAGILRGAWLMIDQLDEATFEQVVDVNLKGTFLCAKHAVRHMRQRGSGVILCISSGAGVRGGSSSVAYGSSKGGVHGLTLVLQPQLEPLGIRVHAICPGSLNTAMKVENVREGAVARGQDPDRAVAEANLGDPAGVARILTFLASADADYLRGTVFTR